MTYNEYASMADFMFETVDRRDCDAHIADPHNPYFVKGDQ